MKSKRNFETLRTQLESERSTFVSHWRDLSDFVMPRRARFTVTDANKGDRRNQKIIDATATLALRTLRSGMMSGVTSPARPWFRLTLANRDVVEEDPIKQWLHTVAQTMNNVFIKSNLYNTLPSIYGDIGLFGTAAMYAEEDFDDVVRFYSFPIGSYMLGNDQKLRPRVFMRDFRMTVRQVVEKFAKRTKSGEYIWDNISNAVRSLWEQGTTEAWIDIVHCVEPNKEFNPGMLESKYKRFASTYYERGYSGGSTLSDLEDTKFLNESGYDYFPILAPRWEVTGEDVYGTECPGMQVLGDVKALQLMQKRKSQAVEKMVNPPMSAPVSMRTQKASTLPGDITYVDSRGDQNGFRPVHEINPRVQELVMDIQETQNRIRRGLFEDLFLMLSSMDRRQITAREIDERHEEKLLALGPVLEQLNQDLLDPLIDITFDILVKQNKIPPPPDELQGQPLKVEYISIMAQAQKYVGISSIDRFVGFVGQVAQFSPTALDKIDIDQAIDIYGDMTSVPPGLVRSDEDVEQIRAKRAQAQAEAQAAQQAKDATAAAKNLSQASMGENGEDNLLNQMINDARTQGGIA